MLEGQPFTPARGLFPNPAAPLRGLPGGVPIDATNPPGRLAQFMRMVDAFERDEIETAVDLLIAHLDARDGDPDLEDDERGAVLMHASGEDAAFDAWHPFDPNPPLQEDDGDGEDHNALEDDFIGHGLATGAGCAIADGGENAADPSWPEWHTRGRHKLAAFGAEAEIGPRGAIGEDDEDDDQDEDGSDWEEAPDGEAGSLAEWQPGGTCPHAYPDDDREEDGPEARERHVERIQRTRCEIEETRFGRGAGYVVRRYRVMPQRGASPPEHWAERMHRELGDRAVSVEGRANWLKPI